MEDISRAIAALTSLIVVNYKRHNVYQALSEKTKDDELRSLCRAHVEQSKRFITTLSTWRSAYGGFRTSDRETGAGSTWSQLRALFDLGLGKTMINRCEVLERDALRNYKLASALPSMPMAIVAEIDLQARELEKVLAKLKILNERTQSVTPMPSRTSAPVRSQRAI
jgi:hypothetical protein